MDASQLNGVNVIDHGAVRVILPDGTLGGVYRYTVKTTLPCKSCEEKDHSFTIDTPVFEHRRNPKARLERLDVSLVSLKKHLEGVA